MQYILNLIFADKNYELGTKTMQSKSEMFYCHRMTKRRLSLEESHLEEGTISMSCSFLELLAWEPFIVRSMSFSNHTFLFLKIHSILYNTLHLIWWTQNFQKISSKVLHEKVWLYNFISFHLPGFLSFRTSIQANSVSWALDPVFNCQLKNMIPGVVPFLVCLIPCLL